MNLNNEKSLTNMIFSKSYHNMISAEIDCSINCSLIVWLIVWLISDLISLIERHVFNGRHVFYLWTNSMLKSLLI
jgi:hypothetical protein